MLSAIRQISNSPDIDDIKQIGKIHVYADQSNLIDIDCLYIDFDCQRIFHLRKAVKKISSSHGGEYIPEAWGAIDVAIRPDGTHFVWDGLHRTILAGHAGFTQIPLSENRHPSRASNLDCQQAEARFFKMRNADSEPMKPEESWKEERSQNTNRRVTYIYIDYHCVPSNYINNYFRVLFLFLLVCFVLLLKKIK